MKQLFKIILVTCMFVPLVLHAHSYDRSVEIAITPDADFSQYAQCDGDLFCEQVREQLIETLKEIIAKLLVQVQALQEVQAATQDLSGIEDTTFAVKSDTTLSGESIGAVHPVALSIWNDFVNIAPEKYIQDYVASYRVYFDEDDFSAAYVETDQNDDSKWVLGVNLSDSNKTSQAQYKNLVETLIHEFAHIVTLNDDQVDFSVSERRCGTYWVDPGCAFKNSYVNQFVDEFWDEDDFDHSQEYQNESDEDQRDDISEDYFEDNLGEFVTPYATSHPAEDIAESFAYFLLYDKTDEETVEEKKINFFYEFAELVEIRENARANFTELFNF